MNNWTWRLINNNSQSYMWEPLSHGSLSLNKLSPYSQLTLAWEKFSKASEEGEMCMDSNSQKGVLGRRIRLLFKLEME